MGIFFPFYCGIGAFFRIVVGIINVIVGFHTHCFCCGSLCRRNFILIQRLCFFLSRRSLFSSRCTVAVPGSFLSVHKKFVFCCILCLCLRTLLRSFRRCALRLFWIFSFCLRRILRLTGIYSLAFLCGRIRQGIFTGKSRKIPHACQIAGKILLAKLGRQGRTFDPQMDIISFLYQLERFYQR